MVSKVKMKGELSLKVSILLSRTGPDAIEADIFTLLASILLAIYLFGRSSVVDLIEPVSEQILW